MNFNEILQTLKEDLPSPKLLASYGKWCDERNLYMDNVKSITEFSKQFPDEREEIEEYLLDVIKTRD
jgi:hypothetical protein